MNDDVHKVLHGAMDDRVSALEAKQAELERPETGTLAVMDKRQETRILRVDTKINWLIAFFFTTVVGVLVSIVTAKLGG